MLTTDVLKATFDSQGGTLVHLELLNYKDAVHRRWYGRWAYGGEDWIAEAAQTDLGESATVTLTVDLAVLDNAAVTATLTAAEFNTTPAVADDGIMHVGEQE